LLYPLAEKLVLSKIKEQLGLEEVRFTSFGAAPLRQTCIDFFTSLGFVLINLYGMTESSAVTTIQENL
jgi:long-subunit acyl-CoA synthetase (AMP-forming)